jgi:hypothetical protein
VGILVLFKEQQTGKRVSDHTRPENSGAQNMDHVLTAKDLKNLMHVMYLDVEDDGDDKCDFEHPMTALGIVLLTATLTGTIDEQAIMGFTGYSRRFVSAIILNMTSVIAQKTEPGSHEGP